MNPRYVLVLISLGLVLNGCSSGPREIQYGSDVCAHCNMTLTDPRFAAELVTKKGKIQVFDSIECLAAFVTRDSTPSGQSYLSNFNQPGTLIKMADAVIVRSENKIRSPMGMNLAAFSATRSPTELAGKFGGNILSWQNVTNLVSDKWQLRNGN